MAMTFPLHALVLVDGLHGNGFLTDHARSSLEVSYEDIGESNRTIGGTLRGYILARKRSLSMSWEMVPADMSCTVDGYWGGNEIKEFYDSTLGTFTVSLYHRNNAFNVNDPLESFEVRFKELSYEVVGRNVQMVNGGTTDLWNVSITLEEV